MTTRQQGISIQNSNRKVSSASLRKHLGVSRNRIPAMAAKFGLAKHDNGFRKIEVIRKVHGIEPMLFEPTLTAFKQSHSRTIVAADVEGKHETEQVCLIEELTDITNLADTLWDQGLVHISDLFAEYGYSYDTFRKKLKSGDVNLPPVKPIELSPNRVMYRPLDVILWRRHGVVLNWPKAVGMSSGSATPSCSAADKEHPATPLSSEGMTSAVFSTAIAAIDEKSGFSPPHAPSPDMLHNSRL